MNKIYDSIGLWPVETVNDIMEVYSLTINDISKFFDIPYRTVQNWASGKAKPSDYVLNMMASIIHLGDANIKLTSDLADAHGNLEDQIKETEQIRLQIEKAQDLLHDGRIREGIRIIDNI